MNTEYVSVIKAWIYDVRKRNINPLRSKSSLAKLIRLPEISTYHDHDRISREQVEYPGRGHVQTMLVRTAHLQNSPRYEMVATLSIISLMIPMLLSRSRRETSGPMATCKVLGDSGIRH
jgi:hypothetical protein